MYESSSRLVAALTAFEVFGTQSRISRVMGAPEKLREAWRTLDDTRKIEIEQEAETLYNRGIQVMLATDEDYPRGLLRQGRPIAPILFFLGSRRHFTARGVGMCGSRMVSDLGLKAARACGVAVSHHGLTIVSGYAKGVDTEAHLAALQEKGCTTIVLAEGINHFRVKRVFDKTFDLERVLVVSQFHPSQPWKAFAAMTRNEVIIGLSEVLVVIEAGEKGGTRAAGESALANQGPVMVLDFGAETPAGNKYLLEHGASAVRSVADLSKRLDELEIVLASEQQLW